MKTPMPTVKKARVIGDMLFINLPNQWIGRQ